MGWKTDDTVLFLGLGALTFAAVHAVAHALRDTVTLTQIHEKPQKQICAISQETEDALDAGSLAVLAESHDRPTKEAAIRILSDRFVRNADAVTSLTRDLHSNNRSARAKAKVLLAMLEKHASDPAPIRFLLQREAPAVILPTVPRAHEESFEEQELRRRRREAVVFHDGGGPVRQDDIIQRSATGDPVRRERDRHRDEALERAIGNAIAARNIISLLSGGTPDIDEGVDAQVGSWTSDHLP